MANNAHERVVVLDFGGQYAQLIARRVRDLGVYCEIKSYKTNPEELRDCKGILFTGGPNSVYAQDAPLCSKEVFELGVPVLCICYGCLLYTSHRGMEPQAALVGANGGVELHAEAAVHLDLAVVVHPGHAEHNLALGLHDALQDAGGLILGVGLDDRLQRGEHLGGGLDKLRLAGIFLLQKFQLFADVRHSICLLYTSRCV